MKRLLKTAWIAAAAPLVVGTVIFIAWLLTRTYALMALLLMYAGLITIFAGLGSVVVALVCQGTYVWRNWHSVEVTRRRLAWQTVALVALVVMNFVFAAVFVEAVILIETRYNLSITNEGREPLNNVQVSVDKFVVTSEDIPAGKTRKIGFWIDRDGTLVLTATRNGQPIRAVVESYVSNSMRGDMKVTIDPSGEAAVEDLSHGRETMFEDD